MNFFFDASAVAKRYIAELGSELIDYLLENVRPQQCRALLIGAGEVLSILVRRRNAGILTNPDYQQAVVEFRHEVVDSHEFLLATAEDHLVRASFGLIDKHSLNATDAVVLQAAVAIARSLTAEDDHLVFVAADARLLRAAAAEGLVTFNPETDTQQRLDQLITGDR